jgi:hypothetical protein
MRPNPSMRHRHPAASPAPGSLRTPIAIGRLAAAAVVLLALAGCAQTLRQMQEISCIDRCQQTKDRCDADARYDFAQCQEGYSVANRDYRYCLAVGDRQCGYPWWPCSENRYGYCTNRYWECRHACQRQPPH